MRGQQMRGAEVGTRRAESRVSAGGDPSPGEPGSSRGRAQWRLGTSLGKLRRRRRCPSSPILASRRHCRGQDADGRRGQRGRHGGGAGVSPGFRSRLLLQHRVLSLVSLAPAKPPGARASEAGCPRVGHADCVSQRRVGRAGRRRAGCRAARWSRQAGRGGRRGWR